VIFANAYRAASKVAESAAALARAQPVAALNPHGIALLAVTFTQREGTRLMGLEEMSHQLRFPLQSVRRRYLPQNRLNASKGPNRSLLDRCC